MLSNWASIPLAYMAYADINLDGVIDAADAAAACGATMGRGVVSHVGSKIGYAGYTQDAYMPTVSHVRHRVYKSDLGRWLQRDPAGYVDGPSLYEYAMSAPVRFVDPWGLMVSGGFGGGASGPGARGCEGGFIPGWVMTHVQFLASTSKRLRKLACGRRYSQDYLPARMQ